MEWDRRFKHVQIPRLTRTYKVLYKVYGSI